jgi:hypothetical protein
MRTLSVGEQVSEALNRTCSEHGRSNPVCEIRVAVREQYRRNRPMVRWHFDRRETLCGL